MSLYWVFVPGLQSVECVTAATVEFEFKSAFDRGLAQLAEESKSTYAQP